MENGTENVVENTEANNFESAAGIDWLTARRPDSTRETVARAFHLAVSPVTRTQGTQNSILYVDINI